ncbi:MAG: hypothetical protein ISR51_09715 [Rhodospirillales bacterium]|nr:hypothetical protein [Rhodospirillales bacterium]
MRISQRIEKLEERSGKQDDRFPPVVIFDFNGAKSEAEAIAEWEAENGPLGKRDPLIIHFCAVSPEDVKP